jgi:hypothetical protein
MEGKLGENMNDDEEEEEHKFEIIKARIALLKKHEKIMDSVKKEG